MRALQAVWSRRGLLPPFVERRGLQRGKQSYYPPHALEQARWVVERLREGQSFEAILAALERGAFRPAAGEGG